MCLFKFLCRFPFFSAVACSWCDCHEHEELREQEVRQEQEVRPEREERPEQEEPTVVYIGRRRRRALIIGINYQDNESWEEISGQQDADRIKAFLLGELQLF